MGGYGYKESLLQFVEGLGPTANKVAQQKIQECIIPPPNTDFQATHHKLLRQGLTELSASSAREDHISGSTSLPFLATRTSSTSQGLSSSIQASSYGVVLAQQASSSIQERETNQLYPGTLTPLVAYRLRVVPLFETVEDLRGAGSVIRKLPYETSELHRVIVGRVMVGYSDSEKMLTASSWRGNRTKPKRTLWLPRNEYGIKVTLFHGREEVLGVVVDPRILPFSPNHGSQNGSRSIMQFA
ncbi:hypothetical protein IFM89_031395 [Coptis chinensis]|uniref:Uncharacterized protein n=1 Tax=Coptis chinensis TaxID=261450 RepID=A0A835HI44_9MAGN|nr:hypothetical protein IFM89_031395 [Coptis chinensis]